MRPRCHPFASWASGEPLGSWAPAPAAIHPSPPGNAGSGCQGYCRLAPGGPLSVLHPASGLRAPRFLQRRKEHRREAGPHVSAPSRRPSGRRPGAGRRAWVSPGPALARGADPRGFPAAAGPGGGARPRAGQRPTRRREGRRGPGGRRGPRPPAPPASLPGRGPKAEGWLCWAASSSGSFY